jgi:hypothetical protein
VFQSFNLINDLNVAENVEVALIYRHVPRYERRKRVAAALDNVGLAHRAKHMPQQLSGGQQQRVAVARALVSDSKIILADEPTGNLDTANGDAVMSMLRSINASGTTLIMVTHSEVHAGIYGFYSTRLGAGYAQSIRCRDPGTCEVVLQRGDIYYCASTPTPSDDRARGQGIYFPLACRSAISHRGTSPPASRRGNGGRGFSRIRHPESGTRCI